MFSSVSHEFRTPINAFSNALSLLKINFEFLQKIFKNVKLSVEEKHQVDKIWETTQKYLRIGNISSTLLLNLTEDILDLAKMEAGIFRLNEEPFLIGSLLEEIEYIFELQ